MLSVVVLISGGGSNLRAILDATKNPMYPVKVLAVGADKPAEGLNHAELFGISTFVVEPGRFETRQEWAKVLLSNIQHFEPDLVVLAGFMRILPPEFVAALSPRLINTHPSLLPNFPGAHGVRDALAAGVTQTGVTIHVVDEGVDTGPHLAQQTVDIIFGESEHQLHERIKVVERTLLVDVLQQLAENKISLPA